MRDAKIDEKAKLIWLMPIDHDSDPDIPIARRLPQGMSNLRLDL